MIIVPEHLKKALLPNEASIQCPFCKERLYYLPYFKCPNFDCSYDFSIRLTGNYKLNSIYFNISLNEKKYSVAQYYEDNQQIIIVDIRNWGTKISLMHLVELDFNNVEEQIGTFLLFS